MRVATNAPSIVPLARSIAAGVGATTLATGPELPSELKALIPPVSPLQRAAIIQGYQAGLAAGLTLSAVEPDPVSDVEDLIRSLAHGPHHPFARLGCATALLGAFACKKAAAASGNAVLQTGGELAYTATKLAASLMSHDLTVVDAALAYGAVAAHALEIVRPESTSAIDAATAGADLLLGHPDAVSALTDFAALQLVVPGR